MRRLSCRVTMSRVYSGHKTKVPGTKHCEICVDVLSINELLQFLDQIG